MNDLHICNNFIHEQYETICVECGRIFESESSHIVDYEPKKYNIYQNYSSVNDVSLLQIKDPIVTEYIKRVIYSLRIKGNNRKGIISMLLLMRYVNNSMYNDIIELIKKFDITIFTNSKKKLIKYISEEKIDDDCIDCNGIIIYYLVYYALQLSIIDATIIDIIKYLQLILSNNGNQLINRCNYKTIALTILNIYTHDKRIVDKKYISLPTLYKASKLITACGADS